MAYTGHKNTMIDGKTLVEYIKPTIEDESRYYNVAMPTDEQVAVVIRALRMHTIMMHAIDYDYSELSKPDEVTRYWPEASSIGRYLRDAPLLTLEKM